jgi:hypothetical protein
MAAAILPAVAAGALLAIVTQLPPLLHQGAEVMAGLPAVVGSLSHRAPRHATPRALGRSADRSDQHSAPFTVSDQTASSRPVQSAPRRHTLAPRGFRSWEGGAAQAGALPPAGAQRLTER